MSDYNFLGLVNDVNVRFNEVKLTSTNFSTAVGFYEDVKNAINSSIQDINQEHFEWPFNHSKDELILTAGTTRYAYPTDAKTIDMDSFRIKKNSTLGNDTVKLQILSYEEYLEKYLDQEYTSDTSVRDTPSHVFRAPSLEFGVVPCPDKAYTLVYEYYRNTVDLIKYDDVPDIPEIFRHVIHEGAMYYAYLFRSNEQSAALAKQKFDRGVKNMRMITINRYDYVRSTMIPQNNRYISTLRVS
jgi:hypothetical protein